MQRICNNDVNECNNSNCWSIAIFGDISDLTPGVSTLFFYLMNTLEVLILILLFCAVPIVLPVLWRSKTFHLNMMRFLVFFVSQSYIYITSRGVLYVFQNGIVKISNQTGDPLDYLVIGATVGRWYQLASCLYVLGAIVIERGCATLYISDYEKEKRSHISSLLIVVVVALSLLQGTGITFSTNKQFHHLLLAFVAFFTLSCGFLCVWIYIYNERRLRSLKNASDKYTLSLKFQLIENMRSFRFIRTGAILGTAGVLIVISPFFVGIIYIEYLNVRVVAGQTFEMLNAICYTGAVVGLPLMTRSWMNEVLRRTRLIRFVRETPARVDILKGRNESDTYFDDLHSVWNTRLEAKINTKERK